MDVASDIAATSWDRGRFDRRSRSPKLLFGCMYEDAAIELQAFRPGGGRVFCIASAGCTALKLAPRHDVVAVDLNPLQLDYVQQRLGGGSVRRGMAERLLAFARALGPLAGWSQSRIRTFLDFEDPPEQLLYWRRFLDTRRFRAALDFLFSPVTLRSIYSTSLLDCLPSNFGTVMRARMKRCFATHGNRTNPYARALLLGEIPFEPGSFANGNVSLIQADAAGFLESEPAESFDGFTLSNILDGANAAYEKRLVAAVRHAAAPGAMVVLRSFREPSFAIPSNQAAEDRSMLWGVVDVRPATSLGL